MEVPHRRAEGIQRETAVGILLKVAGEHPPPLLRRELHVPQDGVEVESDRAFHPEPEHNPAAGDIDPEDLHRPIRAEPPEDVPGVDRLVKKIDLMEFRQNRHIDVPELLAPFPIFAERAAGHEAPAIPGSLEEFGDEEGVVQMAEGAPLPEGQHLRRGHIELVEHLIVAELPRRKREIEPVAPRLLAMADFIDGRHTAHLLRQRNFPYLFSAGPAEQSLFIAQFRVRVDVGESLFKSGSGPFAVIEEVERQPEHGALARQFPFHFYPEFLFVRSGGHISSGHF